MSTFRSPNEMMDAAKQNMLDGDEPVTVEDWEKVFHFLAANIHSSVALSACKLMRSLYNAPLDDEVITLIVKYQVSYCSKKN